ncbi:MAG: DNA polymerase/3'-5' exonuclease PolX [Candidatus Aureabacteria bacterium]|nr:DNA polymerase/3'-5' exonuclease PolX [Candidatus Auribacterota bacterium]
MENRQIADIFTEIADILDINGDNPFRIRSYRNAARAVGDMSENIAAMAREGKDLEQIPGIGKSIAEKIKEIVSTGKLRFLNELRAGLPRGLPELLKIEGLGPRKVKLFYEKLKIDTVDKLEAAAKAGKLHELFRMGDKSEENLIKAIARYRTGQGRFKLSVAFDYAESIINYLKKSKGVKVIEAAGSLRRRKETIGDLDILAICAGGTDIMDRFVGYDGIEEVPAKGTTKSSARLACGIQVDVRVLPKESFGSALQYFTGSKEHNIALRTRAVERKLKISEYGVFRGARCVAGKSEEEVYAAVGLPVIPPELRENHGEIEAAEKGKLPDLIELKDIRGDLQMHTTATDGKASILDMASKARELGYEYIAITEHSKAVKVARGLDEKKLAKHLKAIEKIQDKIPGVRILKGIEVDILPDGSLDLNDGILKECDVVIGAIHYRFNLSEKEMTKRIIRGISNPCVNIFGHPTGRLVLERPSYEVNIEELVRAAKDHGVALEINAHPDRLDLRDIHVRLARDQGVMLVISTDAHSTQNLEFMRYGVFTARRGWAEAKDVINTYPLQKLLKILKRS